MMLKRVLKKSFFLSIRLPVTIGRAGRHKERPTIELTVVEVGAQQVGEVGH